MSTISRMFVPVLISGIAGAITVSIGNSLFPEDPNSSLIAATLVFCTVLTLFAFIRLSAQTQRLERLEEGIRAHEKRMVKKLDSLAATIPHASKIERLERKISVREKNELAARNEDNISARLSTRDEDSGSGKSTARDVGNREPHQNENVIPLHPLPAQGAVAHVSESEAPPAQPLPVNVKRGFSPDGMHIRLQPAVELDTQEVFAFETSVCVTSRYGELHDDPVVRAALETENDYRRFDKFVIDRVLSLVRSLRRQGKSPVIFVGLSKASLKSGNVFDAIEEAFKAQTALNGSLVIEILQSDYAQLSNKRLTSLRKLQELGFPLCISGCTDHDFAADTLESGLFTYVKMPVTELEKIEASALTKPESEIMVACGKHNTKLIVTDVERERQAVHLIDHNISYAQGNFFSPAKFPAATPEPQAKAEKS